MITGDQLAIGKETGRRLGMGANMYPSPSLLGDSRDESIASIPADELAEKADGFAGVFPEHKYEIVRKTQERKHNCSMEGDDIVMMDRHWRKQTLVLLRQMQLMLPGVPQTLF